MLDFGPHRCPPGGQFRALCFVIEPSGQARFESLQGQCCEDAEMLGSEAALFIAPTNASASDECGPCTDIDISPIQSRTPSKRVEATSVVVQGIGHYPCSTRTATTNFKLRLSVLPLSSLILIETTALLI